MLKNVSILNIYNHNYINKMKIYLNNTLDRIINNLI